VTHPTGRTVRDLLTAARAAGADHLVYGLDTDREHVWRTADWQVIYEGTHDGYGRLDIMDRRLARLGRARRSRVAVTSPEQAYAVLAALGVLSAACPSCARRPRPAERTALEDAA
jgi:hypothetical protein